MKPLDVFVVVSGSIGVLTTLPVVVLAIWSTRESRQLRRIQAELAVLMGESRELAEEIRGLQHGIREEQLEGFVQARQDVKDVTAKVGEISNAVSDVGGAVEQAGESTTAAVRDLRELAGPAP